MDVFYYEQKLVSKELYPHEKIRIEQIIMWPDKKKYLLRKWVGHKGVQGWRFISVCLTSWERFPQEVQS